MLRGAFAEIEADSAVTGSIRVVDGTKHSLLVNRGALIDHYQSGDDGFELFNAHKFQESCSHLASFQHPSTNEQFIITITNQMKCTLVRLEQNRLRSVCDSILPAPEIPAVSPPYDRWVASEPHYAVSDEGECYLIAVAAYHNVLHVIRVLFHEEPTMDVFGLKSSTALLLDPRIVNQGRDELALLRDVIHVMGLAFMPMAAKAGDAEGNQLLGVLHRVKGPSHEALNVECISVDLDACQLLPGPWSCRNVHPTSALMYPLINQTSPGAVSSQLPSGILVASSRSLLLFSAPDVSPMQEHRLGESSAGVKGNGAGKMELIRYTLQGVPTCIEQLRGGMFVMGDSMGGLYLLGLQYNSAWCTVLSTSVPAPVASTLCFIPTPSSSQGQAGLLFLGSRCASSQALSVPEGLMQRASQPVSSPKLQVVQPALIPSLAPIHDSVVIQDPLVGGGEQVLVVACGLAPCGRLARVRAGCTLRPAVVGGPEVPASIKMFAIPAVWDQEHHAYLVCSFPATERTEALQLTGSHYTQAGLPGLDCESVSLLVAAVPSCWLLQVTPTAARVLNTNVECAAHGECWKAPGILTFAAHQGSCLAVASSNTVYTLEVHPNTGAFIPGHTLDLSEQVSTLAVLNITERTSDSEMMRMERLYVGVGLWVSNAVHLYSFQGLEKCLEVELQEQCPRSITQMRCHDQDWLFVGTAQGEVMLWPVNVGAEGLSLGAGQRVQISSLEVQLTAVPPRAGQPGYIYAHSQNDAVLQMLDPSLSTSPSTVPKHIPTPPAPEPAAQSDSATPAPTCFVRVSRVHRGNQLRDVCPLHTPALPHGFVWVDARNKLVMGSIDLEYRLHWDTAFIGDTPHHIGWHRGANCLVVLTENADGDSFVRLVDPASLKQVLCFSLERHHHYSSLLINPLPCSSTTLNPASAPSPLSPHRPPPLTTAPSKEFVIIASYLTPHHPYTHLVHDPAATAYPGLVNQMRERDSQGMPATLGMISIFEVATCVLPGPTTDASTVRYQLLCHACLPLPSLCLTMTVATPQWHTEISSLTSSITNSSRLHFSQPSPDPQHGYHSTAANMHISDVPASPSSQPNTPLPTPAPTTRTRTPPTAASQLLLLGCHDGLYMYNVFVDDNLALAQQTVNAAINAISTAEDLEPPELDLEPDQWQQIIAESVLTNQHNLASNIEHTSHASGRDGMSGREELRGDTVAASTSERVQHARGEATSSGQQSHRLKGVSREAAGSAWDRGTAAADNTSSGSAGRSRASNNSKEKVVPGLASSSGGVVGMEGLEGPFTLFSVHESSAGVAPEVERSLRRNWRQRASMELVGRCEAEHSKACITALQASGCYVWASKYLSSVTSYILVSSPQQTLLLPLSVDRSPLFAHSIAALNCMEVVVAGHSRSLQLLQREPLNEALHLHICAQRAEQEFEAGRPAAGQEQSGQDHLKFSRLASQLDIHLDKAATMTTLASWTPTSSITLLRRVGLGLHAQPLQDPSLSPQPPQSISPLPYQTSASSLPSIVSNCDLTQVQRQHALGVDGTAGVPLVTQMSASLTRQVSSTSRDGRLQLAPSLSLDSKSVSLSGSSSTAIMDVADCRSETVLCMSSSGMVSVFVPLVGTLPELRRLLATLDKYPQYVKRLEEVLQQVQALQSGIEESESRLDDNLSQTTDDRFKGSSGRNVSSTTPEGAAGGSGASGSRDKPKQGGLLNFSRGVIESAVGSAAGVFGRLRSQPSSSRGNTREAEQPSSRVEQVPILASSFTSPSWVMDCTCLSLQEWDAALTLMDREVAANACRDIHGQVRDIVAKLLLTCC